MLHDNPLYKSFMKSLKERYTERRIWASEEEVSAYRLFDNEHNVPLAIDIYNNKYLHISIYSISSNNNFDAETYIDLASRSLAISRDRIFCKDRTKTTNAQYEKQETDESTIIWVKEGDLEFKVNLSDYVDTGLFLDHRIARRDLLVGLDHLNVLNLFCYTGSFTVYAAKGNAGFVKSVDMNANYLAWAKENIARNQLEAYNLEWVNSDVLAFLDEEVNTTTKYDLIILDPPIFSNSRKMAKTFDIQKDHTFIINQCLKLLNPNGSILFSTPLTTIKIKTEYINADVRDITEKTTSYDFRRHKNHRSFLITLIKPKKEKKYGKKR